MDIISYALSKGNTQKAVTDYLDEHLTNPTNPPIDTSLSIAGAAADSKATGDKIGGLKEDIANKTSDIINNSAVLGNNINNLPLEDGSISLTTGEDSPNANRARSKGFLECSSNTKYTINYGLTELSGYMWVIGYDSDKNIITDSNVGGYTSVIGYFNNSTGEGTFTTSPTTKYMRWYNTANISRDTVVKMCCLNNWKSDVDLANAIHSKDRYFLVGSSLPTIKILRNTKILVTFEQSADLYVMRESGGYSYKHLVVPANTAFTISPTEILIWDLKTNTLTVSTDNASRNDDILLLNNYNGRPQQGEFLQYVPQYKPITKYNNTGCAKYHKVSGSTTTQGMTVVNDVVWGFNGSDDAHATYYKIVLKDKDTFEQITTIRHNLGHCASADYNDKTDVVMVCNGNLTLDSPPEFYFIKNASSYNSSSSETIDYDDTTKVIKIDVHDLGDYGLVGCFGEDEHIAYFAVTNANATTMFYKCLLGMGAVDYSNNDNGYGTFISGCDDDEYNGTVLVLNSYNGINLDIFQGICFYNGDIYMLLDNSGRKEAYIGKINLVNDSAYEVTETRMMIEEYDASGNKVYYEPEGLCVLDGMYWLFNLALTGQNRLVIVPINNRQGGKGVVGTPITFPFACNSTPNVVITSHTSKTLYISAISNSGFTVSATDGTTGGVFTWVCDIT